MSQDIGDVVERLEGLSMRNLPGDLHGVTAFMRVDINSPVDANGNIDDSKMRVYKEDIEWLASRGARVVLFSHQGKRGKSDCISLNSEERKHRHRDVLSNLLFRHVAFIDQYKTDANAAIGRMLPGGVALLENTRFSEDETRDVIGEAHCGSALARVLGGAAEPKVYIQNAFPNIHRNHASMVAPPYMMPSFVGDRLMRELRAINKVVQGDPESRMLVISGAKVEDAAKYIETALGTRSVGRVFVGGLIGKAFLVAAGRDIGADTEAMLAKYSGEMQGFRRLLATGKILVPVDVTVEGGDWHYDVGRIPKGATAFDVGPKTVEMVGRKIDEGIQYVVFRGPWGMVEDGRFRAGTRASLEMMAEKAKERRLEVILLGGHTLRIAKELGLLDRVPGHKSTAGGAFLTAMTGEISEMPGIDAVIRNRERAVKFLEDAPRIIADAQREMHERNKRGVGGMRREIHVSRSRSKLPG